MSLGVRAGEAAGWQAGGQDVSLSCLSQITFSFDLLLFCPGALEGVQHLPHRCCWELDTISRVALAATRWPIPEAWSLSLL
ncbi:hypothetical protein HPG69_015244, partial [Diceros bicornis minor]